MNDKCIPWVFFWMLFPPKRKTVRLAYAFLRSTRNKLSGYFRKQTKVPRFSRKLCNPETMQLLTMAEEKDRAVDLAAALATAATAAAALPLVH